MGREGRGYAGDKQRGGVGAQFQPGEPDLGGQAQGFGQAGQAQQVFVPAAQGQALRPVIRQQDELAQAEVAAGELFRQVQVDGPLLYQFGEPVELRPGQVHGIIRGLVVRPVVIARRDHPGLQRGRMDGGAGVDPGFFYHFPVRGEAAAGGEGGAHGLFALARVAAHQHQHAVDAGGPGVREAGGDHGRVQAFAYGLLHFRGQAFHAVGDFHAAGPRHRLQENGVHGVAARHAHPADVQFPARELPADLQGARAVAGKKIIAEHEVPYPVAPVEILRHVREIPGAVEPDLQAGFAAHRAESAGIDAAPRGKQHEGGAHGAAALAVHEVFGRVEAQQVGGPAQGGSEPFFKIESLEVRARDKVQVLYLRARGSGGEHAVLQRGRAADAGRRSSFQESQRHFGHGFLAVAYDGDVGAAVAQQGFRHGRGESPSQHQLHARQFCFEPFRHPVDGVAGGALGGYPDYFGAAGPGRANGRGYPLVARRGVQVQARYGDARGAQRGRDQGKPVGRPEIIRRRVRVRRVYK